MRSPGPSPDRRGDLPPAVGRVSDPNIHRHRGRSTSLDTVGSSRTAANQALTGSRPAVSAMIDYHVVDRQSRRFGGPARKRRRGSETAIGSGAAA